VIQVLVRSSSTDLGDLTLAETSCHIRYQSASFSTSTPAFSHEKHASCKKTHSSFDIDLRPSGKDHPQTCAIHLAIGTSVFIILTIQRCSSISFGAGRESGSWVRLKRNFRRQPTHNGNPNKEGRGSETHVSLMKSFIALLHCTFSSSSSLGGWVCHKR